LTYLAYRLGRRWEIRKRVFEDKKRVYTRLEVAIAKFAQALTDYRALQLLQPEKDADIKDMQLLYVKLMGIQSIWLDEGCVDVLRDFMEGEEGEAKATVGKMKEVFEGMKERLGLELGHYMMVRSDIMGRYNQEMQRFKLTQAIRDGLGKVFRLIGQMGTSMAGTSLLAVMDYSAFDKGEDVGSWIKAMQDALSELSKALNDDLQSSSR
jgi:hypothetical protein